jgi:hypothetical protein
MIDARRLAAAWRRGGAGAGISALAASALLSVALSISALRTATARRGASVLIRLLVVIVPALRLGALLARAILGDVADVVGLDFVV